MGSLVKLNITFKYCIFNCCQCSIWIYKITIPLPSPFPGKVDKENIHYKIAIIFFGVLYSHLCYMLSSRKLWPSYKEFSSQHWKVDRGQRGAQICGKLGQNCKVVSGEAKHWSTPLEKCSKAEKETDCSCCNDYELSTQFRKTMIWE